jgi:hypothetical protein
VSENRTAAGQLHFDLDAGPRQVGPSFGQSYRSQPAGFDDAWATAKWAGRLTAINRDYLAEHNLVQPPLTGTSTHAGVES